MEVFDAAYTWTWMHRSEDFCKKNLPFQELLQVLDRYQQSPGIKAWFTSNHDENSWNGTEFEKYGHAAKMLAVFSCTWSGIPLIYSGQELPNLKRLEFFEKDVIEWKDEMELYEFFRTLLRLQSTHPALHFDCKLFRIHSSADETVLCYLRKSKEKEVFVLLNFSARPIRSELFDLRAKGTFRNIFTGEEWSLEQKRTFELKPWDFLVFEK